MADAAKIVSTFGIAFFSFWWSIPAGLALGLPPLVVMITSTVSYSAGVVIVLVVGQPIRDWLMRKLGAKATGNPNSLVRRAWDRFGIIGLGLLAPMTIGSQTGALLGLALNAPPRKLLLWMVIGAMGWALILTGAVLLGVLGAKAVQ
ncbi:MAG TPA: small multi-drug export protein [Aggregatilineales bacterium]|nr:small multi-drug export protein [Aggregatilineales bacterium]